MGHRLTDDPQPTVFGAGAGLAPAKRNSLIAAPAGRRGARAGDRLIRQYNVVSVSLATHSERGVRDRDLDMADAIDRIRVTVT
jgi:hypothetical protein